MDAGLHDQLGVVVTVSRIDCLPAVLEESAHRLVGVARHVDTIAFRPDLDADQNDEDAQLTVHLNTRDTRDDRFPPFTGVTNIAKDSFKDAVTAGVRPDARPYEYVSPPVCPVRVSNSKTKRRKSKRV